MICVVTVVVCTHVHHVVKILEFTSIFVGNELHGKTGFKQQNCVHLVLRLLYT